MVEKIDKKLMQHIPGFDQTAFNTRVMVRLKDLLKEGKVTLDELEQMQQAIEFYELDRVDIYYGALDHEPFLQYGCTSFNTRKTYAEGIDTINHVLKTVPRNIRAGNSYNRPPVTAACDVNEFVMTVKMESHRRLIGGMVQSHAGVDKHVMNIYVPQNRLN